MAFKDSLSYSDKSRPVAINLYEDLKVSLSAAQYPNYKHS